MGRCLILFSDIKIDTVFIHKGLRMIKKNDFSGVLFGGGTFFMSPDDEVEIDIDSQEETHDTH